MDPLCAMRKTIGIIGTRRRDRLSDYLKVKNAFVQVYEKGDRICSGLCPKGGDRFAVILADEFNLPDYEKLWFPANWKKYGRKAGFIRNIDIARESDILIACVSEDRTGGTENTIERFYQLHSKSHFENFKDTLILV